MASKIIGRLRSLYKEEPPKREQLAANEVIGDIAESVRGKPCGTAVEDSSKLDMMFLPTSAA